MATPAKGGPKKIAKARRANEGAASRANTELVKLTAPSAERACPRVRLYKQLDRLFRQGSIVWVNAPAGYGKTLLAAGYLKAHKLRHVWYRLDGGDADPASYFYHLGLAARAHAPRRSPMPRLTPEYALGLPIFVSNYFRELGLRLKSPALMVFDNYQDVPADSTLHGLLAAGIQELPQGISVLVLSRSDPPPEFARLRSMHQFALIGTEAMQLTFDECTAIARLNHSKTTTPDLIRTLQKETGGWAAGLMLLLQSPQRDGHSGMDIGRAHQPVFDYFATEVLRHVPAEIQDLLIKTSILPAVRPAVAQALTGIADAAKRLADLAHRNYFVTAHAKGGSVYQYHPLFQEFLYAEAYRRLGEEGLKALRARAADLLSEAGDVENAVGLWLQAGEIEPAIASILAQAESLIQQGRFQVLQNWLERVPRERRERDPWLLFWHAGAFAVLDMQVAMSGYARAYALFREQGRDVAGMYLSLTTLIDSYLRAWHEFISLDRWLDEVDVLRREHPQIPSPSLADYFTGAVLGAYMMRRPHDPRLRQWAVQAEGVLLRSNEPAAKLGLVRNLLFVYAWLGDFARTESLLDATRDIVSHAATHPIDRMFFCVYDAVQGWHTGDGRRWRAAVERGLKVMQDSGILVTLANMIGQGVYGALSEYDLPTANRYLTRMRETSNFSRHMDAAHYHYLAAWDALQRHAWVEARQLGELGLQGIVAAGIVFPEGLNRSVLAHALYECGDPQAAREQLARVREIGDAIGTPILQIQCDCAEAYFLLREDRETEALAPLCRVFARMRESGLPNYAGWRHSVMSLLCAVALEQGIEPELVSQLVQRRQLRPPIERSVADTWPFPLKIYTLGRFALLRNGKPIRFEGKTQRKPLELLKLLITLGGREVAEARIADVLWPDADADLARQSLKVNLHRLRKLIGEEVFLKSEGKLTLDPQQVWVDVWFCERLLNQSRDQLNANDNQRGIELGQRAIRLYQGPFLAADDQRFVLPLRERLRSKVLVLIGDLAHNLCQTKACRESMTIYRQGIEIDPLTENFYLGLMHCYQCLGQPSEALKIYDQCRNMLKSQLGIEPSSQTKALEQAIRSAGA